MSSCLFSLCVSSLFVKCACTMQPACLTLECGSRAQPWLKASRSGLETFSCNCDDDFTWMSETIPGSGNGAGCARRAGIYRACEQRAPGSSCTLAKRSSFFVVESGAPVQTANNAGRPASMPASHCCCASCRRAAPAHHSLRPCRPMPHVQATAGARGGMHARCSPGVWRRRQA